MNKQQEQVIIDIDMQQLEDHIKKILDPNEVLELISISFNNRQLSLIEVLSGTMPILDELEEHIDSMRTANLLCDDDSKRWFTLSEME